MTLVSKCDHDKIGIGSGWTMLCRYVRRLLDRVLTFIEFLRINSKFSYAVLGSWKKTCVSKTVHHEVGKNPKNLRSSCVFETI